MKETLKIGKEKSIKGREVEEEEEEEEEDEMKEETMTQNVSYDAFRSSLSFSRVFRHHIRFPRLASK